MNSMQHLIAAILVMMSNKYNIRLTAFFCRLGRNPLKKYPNTTYIRWPPFLVMDITIASKHAQYICSKMIKLDHDLI